MNKIKQNYSLELERIIAKNKTEGKRPSVLMHACCAPCSSYVTEYLHEVFSLTMFFFNPNITSEDEYLYRESELCRLLESMPLKNPVGLIKGRYNTDEYFAAVKGLENTGEGGARCAKCFELRLLETALNAKEKGFDYFCTTLTISPMKNAQLINSIGFAIADKVGVPFLPSDFKKKNGYKRSIELSREYNLYRQNYCGCGFSLNESIERANSKQTEN